jgi:hypothetical protein
LVYIHTDFNLTKYFKFYINRCCAVLVNLLASDVQQNCDNFRVNIRVKIATVSGLVCVCMNRV